MVPAGKPFDGLENHAGFARRGEEITMLEFWCIAIFVVLTATSVWLIEALDRMIGGDA